MPEKPPEYDGIPEWAAGIPPILADGFQRQPQESGVRFAVERGPAKQRGGSAATPWDYQCTLRGDRTEIDAFWTFWAERGGRRFVMVDPREDVWRLWRFVIGRQPRETVAAPWFVVAFQLERLD